MACIKWFVFLGFVVMLAACGDDSDLVIETSFDAAVEDVEDSSGSSGRVESSSSSAVYSSAEENSSSSSEFAEEEKGRTISGVAQKGPFVAGSTVKLYELDEKTLTKTGRVFSGEVGSDGDGGFKVSNVELTSPYALFEVTGKFRNELTGEMSDNDITLRAIVDLDGREKVNVNLLTQMTYERILFLFGKGMDFAAAKKQAESEIFKTFNIDDEFGNLEDVNIFDDNEESAALLAIGLLVLGDDEAGLSSFLDAFTKDFRNDGKWDDETTVYKVKYRELDVERIRKNIADWNVGPIPKFGKYLLKIACGFRGWSKCYVECKDEGAFIRKGKESWDICRDGVLFDVDFPTVDTYGWTAGIDGELQKGDSTGRLYKYDEDFKEWLTEWNYADNDYVTLMLNGCTHKREGEVGLNPRDKTYYVCAHFTDSDVGIDEYKWQKAREIDFIKRDNKCESEDVGRIIAGIDTVTNRYYCSANGWVDFMAWSFDVPKEYRFNPDIDYGSMTDKRDGKTYRTVKIGNQTWMAENLNYAGDGIGHCYDDVSENCETGGRLYKWDVARDVCPEGWHLPSKKEFETLFSAVKRVYDKYDKAQYSFADMFKATSGWKNDYTSWTQGLDVVGFSAVPAGGRHIVSYRAPEYNHAGYAAYFLTSTDYDEYSVYIMQLNLETYIGESVVHGVSLVHDYELTQLDGWPHYDIKESEFSVRCLKDAK